MVLLEGVYVTTCQPQTSYGNYNACVPRHVVESETGIIFLEQRSHYGYLMLSIPVLGVLHGISLMASSDQGPWHCGVWCVCSVIAGDPALVVLCCGYTPCHM